MADTLVIEEQASATGCCNTTVEARITTQDAQQLTNELLLLAHPVRLQILDILTQHREQVCVCDIEAAVPVKQPTVSHHLRLLREAGLIDCERRGLWAYYYVRQEAFVALRERLAARLAALA
jgi:ArsR family transcriptional regulator